MMIDTSRTLRIKGSRLKLAVLVLLGLTMTAISASGLYLDVGGNASINGSRAMVAGYVGAPFFFLCTLAAAWRLRRSAATVLTIGPTGIHDTRVARRMIPWTAVSGISTWSYKGQRVIVLQVLPAVEQGLGLTRIARLTRSANVALGADGLCITALGLQINFATLNDICAAYCTAAQQQPQRRARIAF